MSHHEHSAPIPPKLAILLVFFCLGELGESLNIMEGIYLVDIGWHEGSVGLALSLLGLTALIVQPWAGDLVDKTSHDRRLFLVVASIVMAMSASAIFLVREGNYSADHFLIYGFKIMEGIASSFVFPCITALTLATFGPGGFDEVMAVILIWGHMGSVVMTLVTGVAAYFLYPKTMYCFLVGGVTALLAACFVPFVSEGDPLLGRGFQRKEVAVDSNGYRLQRDIPDGNALDITCKISPEAASYLDIVTDKKTCILCFTGFFYQCADANVVLVLGELMGHEGHQNSPNRNSLPLISLAIVIAQLVMAVSTSIGDTLTTRGVGRKPLFFAGLLTLPIRCVLILVWKDSGDMYLLSTQILDGIGGGIFGLMYPLLIADITFGTGRFNLAMGIVASFFGLGSTMSNFLGQLIVEEYGHSASILTSLAVSICPIVLFAFFPETLGDRGRRKSDADASVHTLPIVHIV